VLDWPAKHGEAERDHDDKPDNAKKRGKSQDKPEQMLRLGGVRRKRRLPIVAA